MQEKMTLRVGEKIHLAPDLLLFRFSRPDTFTFLPGQHIIIDIPNTEGVSKRTFSIASAPHETHIEIIVKIVPDGLASLFFEKVITGDVVTAQGPGGNFTLRDSSEEIVFCASGSGISPLRAMIRHLRMQTSIPVVHIYCAGEIGTLHDEFMSYHREEKVRYSRENMGSLKNIPAEKGVFYLCGSPNFVSTTESTLLDLGVAPQQIHYERY